MTNLLLDAWAAVMWKACWQGSLVVLAVWLICLVIPSMPARCRCWLWRLAILKFMIVLLLPTLVNLPLLPAPPIASPVPEVAVQIVRQQVPVVPIEPVESRPSREIELPSLPAILACLWIIIGVGWSFARLLVAWQRTRQLRNQSRMIDNMPLIEELAIQARQYGLRALPALLETEGNGSPMLIGILRPAIVVPGGTLRRLSPPELAMVLGHELAHIRRGDLLWNLVAAVVRSLFFFNPLVWLSQRRLNLAQEVAADELAILRQHGDPVSYGKLLVSVISKLGPSRLIPTMSMGTAGSLQSLTRRLVAMANIGRASRAVIVSSGVILAATVLLGIVPWRLVAAEPKDTKEQQVANVDAVPHANPAITPFTPNENHRVISVDVSETKKGQPKVVISCYTTLFVVGQRFEVQGRNKEKRVFATVHSLVDKKPIQHVIEAKLIRDSEDKNPVTLMFPKLAVTDNRPGCVVVTAADGSELGMEISIFSFNTKATPETPAARQVEVLPAHDQSATKEGSKAESTPAQTRRLVWEPNTDEQKAIAEIERSGGTVWTYEQSPGRPVIGVYFANKRMIVQGVKNGGPPNFAKVLTFRTNMGLLNIEDVTGMHDLRVTQDSDPDVRESKVTNAGLASLNGLPQVQVVSLWGTEVTDAGLENLKGLTNLRTLDLRETKVTDASVKKLQQMLPNCKIIPAGTIHPSSIFPNRQAVIAPDRIYDPIPPIPMPRSR